MNLFKILTLWITTGLIVAACSGDDTSNSGDDQGLSAPSGLTLSVVDGKVIVSWSAVDGVSSYIVGCGLIKRSDNDGTYDQLVNVGGAETEIAFSGLISDTTYYFAVKSKNDKSESDFSVESEIHVDLDPVSPRLELTNIRLLTDRGGRVDWSPDGNWIAFDRLGDDNYYDIWLTRPDGSDEACLTCDHPDLPNKHIGQPAFHPDGEHLLFQAEMANHSSNAYINTAPGSGHYNDLWMMKISTKEVWKLTEVSNGIFTVTGGSLHPVVSHDGTSVFWSDMIGRGSPLENIFGVWQLSLADIVMTPVPHLDLDNRINIQPGEGQEWYESHGWGPDDSWVYFAANSLGQSVFHTDIVRMDIDVPDGIERLTWSGGTEYGDDFGAYDEHAHFTRNFDAFIWLNNESGENELWIADADGSGRRQLTNFNTPGHPHYTLVNGSEGGSEDDIPSDNAWNPFADEGTEQLVLYIQVNFDLGDNRSEFDKICVLDFAWGE